jgi:ribosome assembly protein YihI (activator of Der GTPase)
MEPQQNGEGGFPPCSREEEEKRKERERRRKKFFPCTRTFSLSSELNEEQVEKKNPQVKRRGAIPLPFVFFSRFLLLVL